MEVHVVTRITALCGICGDRHDTFECAVQIGCLELQERFEEHVMATAELIRHLVDHEGWPTLISTEAALRHVVANDDWRRGPHVA